MMMKTQRFGEDVDRFLSPNGLEVLAGRSARPDALVNVNLFWVKVRRHAKGPQNYFVWTFSSQVPVAIK